MVYVTFQWFSPEFTASLLSVVLVFVFPLWNLDELLSNKMEFTLAYAIKCIWIGTVPKREVKWAMWLPLSDTAHLTEFVFHFHSHEHLTEHSFPERSFTGASISWVQSSVHLLKQTTGFHLAYKDKWVAYIFLPQSLVSNWSWRASCKTPTEANICVCVEDAVH